MKRLKTVKSDEEIYSHGLTKREYRKAGFLGILVFLIVFFIFTLGT